MKGTSGIAECGERLAQQLSFGHFGVPGDVMPPGVRLSEVPGVSVMVLQLRSPDRGFLLAVRPSKSLPPFPENTVANRMLYNQQLRVFGCAVFTRHNYDAQSAANSYIPIAVTEAKALIQALPGSVALVAEAQRLAAARKAERELVHEFTAQPLAVSAASAAADSGRTFSMRSFGTSQTSRAAGPTIQASSSSSGAPMAKSTPCSPPTPSQPAAKAPQQQRGTWGPTTHLDRSQRSGISPPWKTTQPSAQTRAAYPACPIPADPCPICVNTYQMTHHIKQKAMCCKQRVCSECSTEILKRAGFGGRSPCPFCRHVPLEVQNATSDTEDAQEVEEARQARLAEDRQLAEVLQDIEDEGMASFANRLARQNPPSEPSGRTWLGVAQEGKVKALEAEVAQLRRLLAARQAPSVPKARAQTSSSPTRSHGLGGGTFKTVLCRYHQIGRCSKGSACTYAHGEGDLQKPHAAYTAPSSSSAPVRREPANYKTVLCEFFERGSCRYGSQCTFAHGAGDLRATATGQSRGASSAVKNWLAARSLCCQAGLGTRVAQTMEGQTEIASWRQRLQDAKFRRQPFSFPPTLSAADRKVLHVLCDELGIRHESRGDGANRCVHVFFDAVSDVGGPDEEEHMDFSYDEREYSEHEVYDDFYDHFDLGDDLSDEE